MSAPTPPRIGRPRDPAMADRIIATTIELLGQRGLAGLTVNDIATTAGVGKAALYRRWTGLDTLLVDVVADLGVREDDIAWPEPGSVRGDLVAILTAATIGNRALAELALLSSVLHIPELRKPWTEGPLRRFAVSLNVYHQRIGKRGERISDGPGLVRIQAALAWLRMDAAHHGGDVTVEIVEQLVDHLLSDPRDSVAPRQHGEPRPDLSAYYPEPTALSDVADETGLPPAKTTGHTPYHWECCGGHPDHLPGCSYAPPAQEETP